MHSKQTHKLTHFLQAIEGRGEGSKSQLNEMMKKTKTRENERMKMCFVYNIDNTKFHFFLFALVFSRFLSYIHTLQVQSVDCAAYWSCSYCCSTEFQWRSSSIFSLKCLSAYIIFFIFMFSASFISKRLDFLQACTFRSLLFLTLPLALPLFLHYFLLPLHDLFTRLLCSEFRFGICRISIMIFHQIVSSA